MIWILKILAFNLSLVLLIELLAGYLLGVKTAKKIITTALINVITNPLAVLCLLSVTIISGDRPLWGVFIVEALVVLTEGFMFSKFNTFDKKNPYLISLILNIMSFTVGEIINIII